MAAGGFGRFLKDIGDSIAGIFKRAPEPPADRERRQPPPVPERRPVQPSRGREEVPYPEGWNTEDKRFWNANIPPFMYRDFDSDAQWAESQDLFEKGWMFPHQPLDRVQPYRRQFFRLTGMPSRMFDWRAFKEWYASAH